MAYADPSLEITIARALREREVPVEHGTGVTLELLDTAWSGSDRALHVGRGTGCTGTQ
jgi:hypothetical protein